MNAEHETRLDLDPHHVVLRPLITEKGTNQSNRYNAYSFEVSMLATKEDVKKAVEALFDVKVRRVRIQHRKGKPRKVRFRRSHTNDWKKAVVTLDSEDRIDFF